MIKKGSVSVAINSIRIKVLTIGMFTVIIGLGIAVNPALSQSGKNEEDKTFKVAAAQLAPVFMDREQTLEKACEAIIEAGEHRAKLIVFPEAFIPGYPEWIWHLRPSQWNQNDELYVTLVKNSVSVPGPITDRLCEVAGQAHINVVIGVDELSEGPSNAQLYNTILFISDKGKLLGKHRKLVPTGPEKLIWAFGDQSTFKAYDTSVGKLSGLICWENHMPLARVALYKFGTQILAAPTGDEYDNWLATIKNNAMEGGMYVINVCALRNKRWIPDKFEFKKYMSDQWFDKGNSCIVGPWGEVLAGPLKTEEGIIYADIDLDRIIADKRMFDAMGNYARPDVFRFSITEEEDR